MASQRSAVARRAPATWLRALVAAGAVAGAIASLFGAAHAVSNAFHHPEPTLRLAMHRPVLMTFGQSRGATLAKPLGYSPTEINLRGALISYDVRTQHFHKGALLPLRVIVTDDKGHTQHPAVPPIQVTGVTRGTLSTWVRTPIKGRTYVVKVEIYVPGTEQTDTPFRSGQVSFRA